MNHIFKTFTSIFTMLVMSGIAVQANGDEYHHIDRLAVKIQQSSKRLLKETVHYRHTPEYEHLVADANELYRLASHVHEVTHFAGNLTHLQHDVDALDRQFHHLDGVFDRIEHNAAYGDGHVHGNTIHIKRLLNSIEDSIHHMTEDLQAIRNCVMVEPPVCAVPVRRPVYGGSYGRGWSYSRSGSYGHGGSGYENVRPVRGAYGGGVGFSIGGGSSRIDIRF